MGLKKFYDNVKIVNDKLVEYKDDDGNISIFPIAGLLCKCEYLKVDDERLNIMKFNQEVDKNMKYERISEKIPYADPKNKSHITEKTILVNKMWKVSNAVGITEVFNDKEVAESLVNEINSKYLDKVNI